MRISTYIILLLVTFSLTALLITKTSQASVALLDADQWKVNMSGFVEFDTINDSTRSFNEVIGNAPVSRPDSVQGQSGREQFSIRNSRLAFTVIAPEQYDWKTKGYLEFDLLGYDPSPGTTNTEAGLYNNPTLRVRHAYIQANHESWSLLAGQTWAVFGWQPYYFMPSVQVAPVPSMLYSRTTQFRATHTSDFASDSHLQEVLGIMRPPQRDSGLPGLEGGVRVSYDGWSGGYVAGSTPAQKTQPLSIGVSGAVREFSVPTNTASPTGAMTHFMGSALAIDTLIPVIPSKDGKDVSNTLTIGGEFTQGKGDGDQFGSWTGGLYNPLNAATTAPTKNLYLDSGIGGYDANNNFNLVDLRTYNLYAQYHLAAAMRMWFDVGFGRLFSDNVGSLGNSLTTSSSGATLGYNKEQVAFVNAFKDLTDHVRLGLEYAQIQTTYIDGTIANDNRFQLSAWFIF